MGPIFEEKNEPVFHHEWEGRIFAMNRAVGAWRKWNLDASRHSRELIPPAEYLRMSYYERWVEGLVELIVQSGLTTRAEIESGGPASESVRAIPALTVDKALILVAKAVPASRNVNVAARFQVGECGCTVPGGPASACPEHASDRAHTVAAIRPREIRDDWPGSRYFRFSGHQCSFPRRETAACIFSVLYCARAVGRAGRGERFRVCRFVGRLP